MKLVWKSFSLCKDGNREEENEDAVYPQLVNGSSLITDQFSCAMADGATSSSFSKLWANLLVKESSLSQNLQVEFTQTINTARNSWQNELVNKELPWPTTIKLRQGSFSTLLWFHIWQKTSIFPSSNGASDRGWNASAVGDTCLFHVIKGQFSISFPLTQTAQFSNTPELISTNLAYQRSRITNRSSMGSWQRGDHFLIASDALAAWLIEGMEAKTLVWSLVSDNLTSQVRFQSWIRTLRRQSRIKNDDTSLIALSVDE